MTKYNDNNKEPPWCKASPTEHLQLQALSFLQNIINASFTHPKCNTNGSWSYEHATAPSMTNYGSHFQSCLSQHKEETSSFLDVDSVITLYYRTMPVLIAMTELWIRLIAFFSIPLCVSCLIHYEMTAITSTCTTTTTTNGRLKVHYPWKSCAFGLVCSWVVATDSVYVIEYGHSFGFAMLLLHAALFLKYAIAQHTTATASSTRTSYFSLCSKVVVIVVALVSYVCTKNVNDAEVPTFDAGLYYSTGNSYIQAIIQSWPQSAQYSYDTAHATPYLITGDARTGIPFLVNAVPLDVTYTRVWIPSSVDEEESIALDIAFPPSPTAHCATKPIYMVLHGLNGGSDEGYVREFTKARTEEGSIVIVLIARGLMDTPVLGWNVFHGARVSDLHDALHSIRTAVSTTTDTNHNPKAAPVVIGVGYSMGAIILGNYMARCSTACLLDAAVSISGGLDMRHQLHFERSKRLWQPLLADELRNIVMAKFCERYRHRLLKTDFLNFLRSTSVSEIDEYAVVKYNGFNNITHYYTEMSAMGDFQSFDNEHQIGRIRNVSRPFLVIHALDDPLVTWKTLGPNPDRLVQSGEGNIIMLITNTGGHVGWPQGFFPRRKGWSWMNDVVRDFATAIDVVHTKSLEN